MGPQSNLTKRYITLVLLWCRFSLFILQGKLSFEGTYKDDVRCGFGVLHNPDGGWYEGNFDENTGKPCTAFFTLLTSTGAIHGDITYFFAPNLPVLRGKWEHGEMKNAAFYTYKGMLAYYVCVLT